MAANDTFTLDSAWLVYKRSQIKDEIARARYKVGNTWHDATIEGVTVLADGRIEVEFIIDHTVAGNITVTAVELYNRYGTRIGGRPVSITRADATEAISYVLRIGMFQIVENGSNTGAWDKL